MKHICYCLVIIFSVCTICKTWIYIEHPDEQNCDHELAEEIILQPTTITPTYIIE